MGCCTSNPSGSTAPANKDGAHPLPPAKNGAKKAAMTPATANGKKAPPPPTPTALSAEEKIKERDRLERERNEKEREAIKAKGGFLKADSTDSALVAPPPDAPAVELHLESQVKPMNDDAEKKDEGETGPEHAAGAHGPSSEDHKAGDYSDVDRSSPPDASVTKMRTPESNSVAPTPAAAAAAAAADPHDADQHEEQHEQEEGGEKKAPAPAAGVEQTPERAVAPHAPSEDRAAADRATSTARVEEVVGDDADAPSPPRRGNDEDTKIFKRTPPPPPSLTPTKEQKEETEDESPQKVEVQAVAEKPLHPLEEVPEPRESSRLSAPEGVPLPDEDEAAAPRTAMTVEPAIRAEAPARLEEVEIAVTSPCEKDEDAEEEGGESGLLAQPPPTNALAQILASKGNAEAPRAPIELTSTTTSSRHTEEDRAPEEGEEREDPITFTESEGAARPHLRSPPRDEFAEAQREEVGEEQEEEKAATPRPVAPTVVVTNSVEREQGGEISDSDQAPPVLETASMAMAAEPVEAEPVAGGPRVPRRLAPPLPSPQSNEDEEHHHPPHPEASKEAEEEEKKEPVETAITSNNNNNNNNNADRITKPTPTSPPPARPVPALLSPVPTDAAEKPRAPETDESYYGNEEEDEKSEDFK